MKDGDGEGWRRALSHDGGLPSEDGGGLILALAKRPTLAMPSRQDTTGEPERKARSLELPRAMKEGQASGKGTWEEAGAGAGGEDYEPSIRGASGSALERLKNRLSLFRRGWFGGVRRRQERQKQKSAFQNVSRGRRAWRSAAASFLMRTGLVEGSGDAVFVIHQFDDLDELVMAACVALMQRRAVSEWVPDRVRSEIANGSSDATPRTEEVVRMIEAKVAREIQERPVPWEIILLIKLYRESLGKQRRSLSRL